MRPGPGQNPCVGGRLDDTIAYVFFFVAGAAFSILVLPATSAALSAAWRGAVLIIVRSDLATLTIPDEASLAIAAFGIIQAFLKSDRSDPAWLHVTDAVLGGLVAFLVFWAVKVGYRRWRGHEGLGFGDVKLAGACAVWLGTSEQIIALELAAASAAALTLVKAHQHKGAPIPFGAFLAPAAWLVFVASCWLRTP